MQLSLGPSFAPAGELALGPDAVLLRGLALADADRLADRKSVV